MKKFLTIVMTLLFIGISVSTASSATVGLYDWAFYVDGATYEASMGDSMPTAGALDASGLGTLTWTTNIVGGHTFIAFFDHEIDEAINTFFNEYGDTSGTPVAGQSWEIDEPGYVFGDIYWNVLDGALDNFNNVPMGLEDDVSMAIGWDFSLSDPLNPATITLTLSETAPQSGFYLSHTDPDSDHSIYFSSALALDTAAIPEPGTLILLFTGIVGFLGIKRKKAV